MKHHTSACRDSDGELAENLHRGSEIVVGAAIPWAMVAHYLLGWDWRPSWLAGVALSTTSVAVAYSAMLELGFNQTTYGKARLAACSLTISGPFWRLV
jgi:Kef-type K+ transport system membrane component KefB